MARTGKAILKSAIIIVRLYQLEIDATDIYRETCISQVYKRGTDTDALSYKFKLRN